MLTLSACHALRASEAGERVLIISVDPARRLAQCLGKEPIGLEPVEVPGAPGLFAALSLPVEGMDLLIRRGAVAVNGYDACENIACFSSGKS